MIIMDLFEILKNLFTNPHSKWILELDDKDINIFIIQRYLALYHDSSTKAVMLNKFTKLEPKMYLSLAWSLLWFNGAKLNKVPFIKYPQKENRRVYYDNILNAVKKYLDMSDNEFNDVVEFILPDIEKDKYPWFKAFGMNESEYKSHGLDFKMS